MMEMEINGGALFSVVFFDGDKDIDLGNVFITPSMNFKQFQTLISTKIGISPHQITTYFTPFNHHTPHRRRHPVTNKFNFAAAIPESTSSFFWVVLKRSRRVRRRKPRIVDHNDGIGVGVGMMENNFVLLRRNPNDIMVGPGYADVDYMDYVNRLKMLEMEKERYLLSLNLNSNVYDDMNSYLWGQHQQQQWSNNNNCYYGTATTMSSDDGASSSGAGSESRVLCDVCLNGRFDNGDSVPFHCCKNDAITKPFRSPAGPIGPPLRKIFN